jgi:hypothetical protein
MQMMESLLWVQRLMEEVGRDDLRFGRKAGDDWK